MPGHFTPLETDNVGPNGDYTTIAPKELGEGEIKHPILVWGPGAGAWPGIYQTLLNHIASHGFVIVSYNSTPQGPELMTAIDWIVAESTRDGSPYFNKVDTTKIAAAGQSAGSLATFVVADDPRLTTTMHINGGTFDPHTDVMKLVKPALFVCGDDPAVTGGDGTAVSDLARPNCDYDFEHANAPVWYGDVIGASHTTVIDNPLSGTNAADDPLMKHFLAATAAWLRWQLAGDQVMKALFVGPSCGFCMETSAWKVQQKNL
jgi:dienelactone hydrolase